MNTLSHVAIIMDGNGRWAKKKNKKRHSGHRAGILNISKIIRTCQKENIKFLTLYVFSVDNWKRSKREVDYLFNLIESFFKKKINQLIKNKIKIKIFGEKVGLNNNLIKRFKNIENKTSYDFNITVNLAFNYSSQLEIVNAVKNIINNNYLKKEINKELIENYLYTSKLPNPDILIRTGGYNRLSDFLLWQISYTEIFFLKKLWPDFNQSDLIKIIKKFKKIKRNYGALSE